MEKCADQQQKMIVCQVSEIHHQFHGEIFLGGQSAHIWGYELL